MRIFLADPKAPPPKTRRLGSRLPLSVERRRVQHTEWEIDERDHFQLFRRRPFGAHSPANSFPGWFSFGLAARVQQSPWPMKWRSPRPRETLSPFPSLQARWPKPRKPRHSTIHHAEFERGLKSAAPHASPGSERDTARKNAGAALSEILTCQSAIEAKRLIWLSGRIGTTIAE